MSMCACVKTWVLFWKNTWWCTPFIFDPGKKWIWPASQHLLILHVAVGHFDVARRDQPLCTRVRDWLQSTCGYNGEEWAAFLVGIIKRPCCHTSPHPDWWNLHFLWVNLPFGHDSCCIPHVDSDFGDDSPAPWAHGPVMAPRSCSAASWSLARACAWSAACRIAWWAAARRFPSAAQLQKIRSPKLTGHGLYTP